MTEGVRLGGPRVGIHDVPARIEQEGGVASVVPDRAALGANEVHPFACGPAAGVHAQLALTVETCMRERVSR